MTDYRLSLLVVAGMVVCGLPQNMFATAVKTIALETHAPSVDDLAARMASAYWLIAGPLGAVAGSLADQVPRRRVLLCSAVLSAASALGAALSPSHATLLLARAGQGAAAGAFLPAAYSAVADLLPDESGRPVYAARLGVVMGIGSAAPQLALGVLGQHWWRSIAGFCAGLGALVSVLLWLAWPEPRRGRLWLAWPEPRRGSSPGPGRGRSKAQLAPAPVPAGQAGAGYVPSLLLHRIGEAGSAMVDVSKVRTNRYILSQGLVGTIPWTIVSLFLPPALLTSMSSAHASLTMLAFGLGGLLGGVAGGRVGAWAYTHWPNPQATLPRVVGALQACGSIPLSLLLLAHAHVFVCATTGGSSSVGQGGEGWGPCSHGAGLAGQTLLPSAALLAVAAVGGVVSSMAGPNLRSILLAVNPPSGRATAFALGSLLDALAKGCAPLAVAQALAWAGEEPRARAWTLAAAIVTGWCGSGLLIACTGSSYGEDERRAKGQE